MIAPPRPLVTPQERRPSRILCVDDEAAIREILQLLFGRQGHAVDIAPDGIAAWELLCRSPGAYDLVITDNEMPRLGGMALVRRLRESNFGGRVIVYSSSLSDADIRTLRAWAIDAIVEKGGPAVKLLDTVNAVLDASVVTPSA